VAPPAPRFPSRKKWEARFGNLPIARRPAGETKARFCRFLPRPADVRAASFRLRRGKRKAAAMNSARKIRLQLTRGRYE